MNKSIVLFALSTIWLSSCSDTEDAILVRIKNPTAHKYTKLIVSSCGSGNINFDEVDSMQTSSYKPFKSACDGAKFKFFAGPNYYEFTGGGTTPLSNGKYTYKLTVEFVGGSNQIGYALIKD